MQACAKEASSNFGSAQSGRTTLGAWVKAICRAMAAAGCDSSGELADAGYELEGLDGPDVRCPLELSIRLWNRAVEVTQDHAFGLKAAGYIMNNSYHALSYGILSSSTLKEAFERSMRYSRWVSDVVTYQFVHRGGEYHFVMETAVEVPDVSVDCLIGAILRMCRALIGREFSPLRIELKRSAPPKLEDFNAILRAPLRFDAPKTLMVFDAKSMERRLSAGNPELAQANDAIALRYLANTEIRSIALRVRELLITKLADGEPSGEDVARLLNMSVRTLQRKLVHSGTTYREVLDDTRRDLALSYLKVSLYSVTTITYMLGYSATSSFTRAFRRWTGQSPTDWRARAGLRELHDSDKGPRAPR
jgi:AraC-like DNA-binding protein